MRNTWHAIADSDALRRFAKQGAGRALFRSSAARRLDLARNGVRSRLAARRDSARFEHVRTFCFFVGHNKSGTSLVGGLLDAHPHVILSDEVDVLRYVEAGFRRDQIFHLLLRGSEVEARKGRVTARRLQGYSYAVPGQYQGRSIRPLVVGDSTSGSSTRRLGERPELFDAVARLMEGTDVRLIHVIRNPFDPISAMMVRGRRTFSDAIDRYFAACQTLLEIRRRVEPGSLCPVAYEEFVGQPVEELARVCRFLTVSAEPSYLQACASILHSRPDRSREMVSWTPRWIETVERRIDEVDFLKGYSYDS